MNTKVALSIIAILYITAGTLDYQDAVHANEAFQCSTDSECEGIVYDEPIASYAEWVDVGCTEESRMNDVEFDALCTNYEREHPEQDFTHN